jgi:hypothetical protein
VHAGRPWARTDRAAERAAGFICRTGQRACAVGRGPQKATGRNCFFSVILFTDYSFVVFVQFFEQISYSPFYSNYSNENFFREFKSDRKFSVKYKVNEFFNSLFPLQIVK